MFINIVFWLGRDRPSGRDFFLSCPLYFFPYSRLSPYLLRLSLFLILFLLFPWTSVWEITRARVQHFLLPYWMVLHFFLSLVQEKLLNMPSGHYYRHCSWSGRSIHLIPKKIKPAEDSWNFNNKKRRCTLCIHSLCFYCRT